MTNEFRVGWRVVAASLFGIGLGQSAIPFYTLGIFAKPLAEAFGWTRAQVMASQSFTAVGTLLGAWLIGWSADRHGARRVALCSQLGLAAGLVLLSLNQGRVGTWYASWVLMIVLGVGTSPILFTRCLAGWFDSRRGLAFGIAMAGSGFAGLILPPLVTWLIATQGWRMAYLWLAAAVVLIAMPINLLWLRTRAAPKGAASTFAARAMANAESSGMTLSAALRGYRFWVLIAAFAAVSFGVAGTIGNLVPLLTDHGVSRAEAAYYASIAGFAVIVGRVLTGFLLDRLWAPLVALICLSPPALSCLLLSQPQLSQGLAGLAAALVGLAAGAEFDLLAYLSTRYFGTRHYAQIYAWQWVALMVGAGAASPVYGHVYDLFGNYAPILRAVALAMLLAPLLMLSLGRYPKVFR